MSESVFSVNVNIKYFSFFICVRVCGVHAYVMCMFICMHTHMCVPECEGLRLMSGVLLNGSLLKQTLSLNLGLAILASPAS